MRIGAVIVLLGFSVAGCGDGGSLVQNAPKKSQNPTLRPSEPTPAMDPLPQQSPDAENDTSSAHSNAVADSNSGSTTQTPGRSTPIPDTTKVEVIGFDDLNLGMPEDARFRPIMLEFNDGRAKGLLGKVVNLGGYMNPPDELRGLTEFVLLKNTNCKFGPGGQADHLARVYMKEGTTIDYTDQVIYVEGRIVLKPFPDNSPITWSIYDIEATNVSTRAPSRRR